MKQLFMFLFILTVILGISSHSQADLFNRGADNQDNRLIYDSDLNITWYDYTNSKPDPFGGVMGDTWQNQMDWASNLTVNFSGTIYDDWRLPSTVDGTYVWGYDGTTTGGYNITSSEMGYLFYTELVNKGYYSTTGAYQSDYGLNNKGPFINLQPRLYWLGTLYTASTDFAWDFDTSRGGQYIDLKYGGYALAVRAGDVAVVPEPISAMLFVTGGAFLTGRRLLKKKKA